MKRRIGLLGVATAVIVGISGCANPEDDGVAQGSTASPVDVEQRTFEPVPEIEEMVPQEYQERGSFTVSINPDVPPIKYTNNEGVMSGLNPDILRAAGEIMDLEIEIERGSFDSMIPGLESDRFDVIGSIGDYVERQENIDFINYLYAGTGIIAGVDFEMDEALPEELCGASIGYVIGTQQQGLVPAASEECEARGEDPISGTSYRDAAASILAVRSGQEDGAWIDTPAALYNASQEPDVFKVIYTVDDPGVYGIGVSKDNTEFREALHAAIRELESSGAYSEFVAEYGLERLELEEIPLNQGQSIDG